MMEAHQLIKNIIPAPDSIKLTNEEIFRDCLNGDLQRFGVREMTRIGRVMLSSGWVKGVHWDPQTKSKKRGYRRPSLDQKILDSIAAIREIE